MKKIVEKPNRKRLHLPVVAEGAEYLVRGYLARRNILAYKAPARNEGYDLICIHPEPRHKPGNGQLAQVRVQVKSRAAISRHMPHVMVKDRALEAFDFLVLVYMNIAQADADPDTPPELYTLPVELVRQRLHQAPSWKTAYLSPRKGEMAAYRGAAGLELIAQALGVPRPGRGD